MKKFCLTVGILILGTRAWGSYSGYTYQQIISISSSNISQVNHSSITNFSVYVSTFQVALTTQTTGGHLANANGYDMKFSSNSDCSSTLFFDTVTINTVGISTYAAIVNVPVLSTAAVTTLYLCYGNASITSYQGGAPSSAYDSSYKGVYHMTEALTTSGQNMKDSSALNAPMTTYIQGSSSFGSAAGKLYGNAVRYIPQNEFGGAYSSATVLTGITGNVSIEFWIFVNPTTPQDPNSSMDMGAWNPTNSSSQSGLLVDIRTDAGGGNPNQAFATRDDNSFSATATSTSSFSTSTWTHYVATSSGTNVSFYKNGVLASSTTNTNVGFTSLGAAVGNISVGFRFLDLDMNEFRISNVARSADWINTEYLNQSSPATFTTFGSETTNAISTTSSMFQVF